LVGVPIFSAMPPAVRDAIYKEFGQVRDVRASAEHWPGLAFVFKASDHGALKFYLVLACRNSLIGVC
jgi:hypothetical protein